MRGSRLTLTSELRPVSGKNVEDTYLLHDPPLSLFSEAYGGTLRFSGDGDDRQLTLTVPANATGPEQTFVLRAHGGARM